MLKAMNAHLFAAYCLAVAILLLIPGPVVTLVVANSLSHGRRSGLVTVAGASIGNAILLGATAVGLIAFFRLLSEVFEIVRWAGAAYLIWLGIRAWRTHDAREGAIAPAAARSSRAVFLQGFVIAITNPKAIFILHRIPAAVRRSAPAGGTAASADDRNDDRHGRADGQQLRTARGPRAGLVHGAEAAQVAEPDLGDTVDRRRLWSPRRAPRQVNRWRTQRPLLVLSVPVQVSSFVSASGLR
jgi:threonine/homoserine/homoserine lactone efflux protein